MTFIFLLESREIICAKECVVIVGGATVLNLPALDLPVTSSAAHSGAVKLKKSCLSTTIV